MFQKNNIVYKSTTEFLHFLNTKLEDKKKDKKVKKSNNINYNKNPNLLSYNK
jgi:hypothetical protein